MGKYVKSDADMTDDERAIRDMCVASIGTEASEELTQFQENFGPHAMSITVAQMTLMYALEGLDPVAVIATTAIAGAYRIRDILSQIDPEAVAKLDQWLVDHKDDEGEEG